MNRQSYLVLGLIIFTILSILAFDLYVLKFGKFWEKKLPSQDQILHLQESITMPTSPPNSSITLQEADSVIKKIATTIIKPELIPQTPATVNITPNDTGSSNTTISFASSWKDNKGVVFQINASFKKNSSIVNSYDVVIGIPKGMIKTLDSSSATKFAVDYINPLLKPIFKCEHNNKKIPEFTACEASLEEFSKMRSALQVVYPL